MAKPKDSKEKAKNIDIDIDIDDADQSGQNDKNGDIKPQTEEGPAEAAESESSECEKESDGNPASAKPSPSEKATDPEEAEKSLAAEKDRYLRLAAEYDNFRKRTAKERDMTYSMAQADAIAKLLPVHDSLERALKQTNPEEAHYKGLELTMQQMKEILKDMGVEPIPALGEKFDANVHHAVLRIENPELGEGVIAEECTKGFIQGERVIRFSEVIVAN